MQRTLDIALPQRLLIVNADDLGACRERDAGILEAFAYGAVTSASLLVDGDSAADAAARAVAAGLPLGLHLNLTEGALASPGLSPHSPPNSPANSLADASAQRLGKFGLRAAFAAGRVRDADLLAEIRRQFERFIALTGDLPDHVDGHHHIHVEAPVAALLAAVMAREYGVYRVRLPREDGLDALAGDTEFDAGFQRGVVRATAAAAAVFAAQGICGTDAFVGQSLMGTRLDAARVGRALAALAANAAARPLSVELMVHPGHPASAATGSDFCRSPARAHELAVLAADDWKSATAGWTPVSYGELPRPQANAPRPTVLIYGKLTPATGNAETARRYAAALAASADIRFRPLPPPETAPTQEAERLRRFAARERLDLALGIHLHRAGVPLAAAFAGDEAPPLPYGLLASGTDVNADIDHAERAAAVAQALASADFLLCLNDAQARRLAASAAIRLPAETTVLGSGIDVASDSRFSLRHALQLADDARCILFPAALRRLKGVLPTLCALAEPLATRFTKHVLIVLGPPLEDDYAGETAAAVAALIARHPGLAGRLVLHPGLPRADYLAALAGAALVINASEHEGQSHALLEAMAAGVPVLARDVPGNRELVRDGENGRLFADFAALPAAYAACFDDAASTARLAARARQEVADRFAPAAERDALAALLARVLARRQTALPFAGGMLRLDRAAATHPVSAENLALFAQLSLSPAARKDWPATLPLVADIGCGCGVFGLRLLDALAAGGRRVGRLLFTDPHAASLAALSRTLTRHRSQLAMLDQAELDDGSLLAPLIERGERAQALCCNLPQTPAPQGFRLDRWGGADGAELILRLLADLPQALADDGEAFLLHIDLAHPARVARAIADRSLAVEVLAEDERHARFADYEALHAGLADYLRAEQAAGRAEFAPDADGDGFRYRARLLRLRRRII